MANADAARAMQALNGTISTDARYVSMKPKAKGNLTVTVTADNDATERSATPGRSRRL
jgi:hypothetical protein